VPVKKAGATVKPDARLHNPDPLYLRELIAASGLTQVAAAQTIGIDPRVLRLYLSSDPKTSTAPYPVQYALERLADR
jgi:hypothetical protein